MVAAMLIQYFWIFVIVVPVVMIVLVIIVRFHRSQIKWQYWFELNEWTSEIFVRLIKCGSHQCIHECIKGTITSPGCKWLKNLDSLKFMCEQEFKSPSAPANFIIWASAKKSIKIPQKMNNWYCSDNDNVNTVLDINTDSKIKKIFEKYIDDKTKIRNLTAYMISLHKIDKASIHRSLSPQSSATSESIRHEVDSWIRNAKKLIQDD
jgi:catalase (peroxidase I)